jgi:hypothetical protein
MFDSKSMVTLVTLLGSGLALGAGFIFILGLVVRREFLRWSVAIDRIPDREWFSKVAVSLDVLAGQAVMLADHTGDICDLKHDLATLASAGKLDHDALTALTTEHKLIRDNCLVRSGPPDGVERRRPIPALG